METIFTGTDLSASATSALVWAADIASAFDARMIAVSAVEAETIATADQIEERLRLTRSLLGAELERLGGDVRGVARFGDPRDVLISVTHQEGADLIIVGAPTTVSGDGVIRHLLHHAHCPVAVVPEGSPSLRGGTVVVGVDGSKANERALAWAVDAARAVSGSVDAVYAYHPAFGPADYPPIESGHSAGVEERSAKSLVEKYASSDVRVDYRRVNGDRSTVLRDYAKKVDASVLVVGTRGRGSLAGRIVGRVPNQILETPAQPIVIVPGHNGE